MTFDPSEHPRSTDGTFAEKVGAAPELTLDDTAAAREALAEYLNDSVTPHEEGEVYGLPFVYVGREAFDHTYAFGTAEQADAAARRSVERNLWDVSSVTLSKETGLSVDSFEEWSDDAYESDELDKYQQNIHELVSERAEGGVQGFTARFIAEHGRGAALAAWDHEERTFPVGDQTHFLYRVS